MSFRSITEKLKLSSLTEELAKRCTRKDKLTIQGASRSAKAIISSSIAKSENRPLLVIVSTSEEANRWYSLMNIMGWTNTYIYPNTDSSPYDTSYESTEIIWGQLQLLVDLIASPNTTNTVIIATERSLQPHLPPLETLKSKCINIRKSLQLDLDQLCHQLTLIGYKRVTTIDQEGTWSRRGDIIDIYPVSCELPCRLEFFGDELDKIKEFDPITQRSLDIISDINIPPTNFRNIILEGLKDIDEEYLSKCMRSELVEQIKESIDSNELSSYMGLAWEKPFSLLDYIPKNTCIAIDEREQCLSHGQMWLANAKLSFDELNPRTDEPKDLEKREWKGNLHSNLQQLYDKLDTLYGFDLREIKEEDGKVNVFDVNSKAIKSYPNQFGKISETIRDLTKNKIATWIMSAQPSRAVALLEEHDTNSKFIPNIADFQSIQNTIEDNTPVALKATSNTELEGLILPPWKIAILTDKEFFGQQVFETTGYIRRRKGSSSASINPTKMIPGDYVVHRSHGIGRFEKLEKISVSNQIRDYLVVRYLDGTLSVAADQLGSLSRYRSTGDNKPKVNKLGGSTWNKTKDRTRKSIKKLALDLVKLYAERSTVEGYRFPVDGPWQNELEDSFPYQPTPDQYKAITEVKSDMETDKPMDRLVCGDVGFGKTEVAIRAIFKAITSGKQVAFLAPTTVLSQQHWRTISTRFAPYPIQVGLLNRFKSTQERKDLLTRIEHGNLDAVIGTHQLLSRNIKFKDLGLLVIDEEQRFGVAQKEKIKSVKKNIDVLTLSATPIPRTLYMSLSGVREMSLITTPPPSRRAIKTHLSSYDYETIRSAICQEVDRGGQIFYVVPRVEGIEEVLGLINKMVPKLKILIAHGQMNEGELENAMIAFNQGDADLLLCTTIIESGLDIPRVNTIIIEDSHKFGLSQLYQLRGRVGRSGVQAHAWLLYPRETALSDTARRRLRAIQEFAELGSGYQLAMRDMEIRGVGNLLGVEQSGQMETIGFDLYMEMLQEELAEIQGQSIPLVEDTQIDLKVTAFIPAEWIDNNDDKIAAYRAATNCKNLVELLDLVTLWQDRFGKLPASVETLIEVMKLKLIAKECGFLRITPKNQNIELQTTMKEGAFRLLRKGLPVHLHGRLIYKILKGDLAIVTARGVGILEPPKQLELLTDWMSMMAKEIPNPTEKQPLP